jgi:hypothetical protein
VKKEYEEKQRKKKEKEKEKKETDKSDEKGKKEDSKTDGDKKPDEKTANEVRLLSIPTPTSVTDIHISRRTLRPKCPRSRMNLGSLS